MSQNKPQPLTPDELHSLRCGNHRYWDLDRLLATVDQLQDQLAPFLQVIKDDDEYSDAEGLVAAFIKEQERLNDQLAAMTAERDAAMRGERLASDALFEDYKNSPDSKLLTFSAWLRQAITLVRAEGRREGRREARREAKALADKIQAAPKMKFDLTPWS